MSDNRITVIQVFELMGVKPTKKLTWAVGDRMQHIYRKENGVEPPKGNRPKTGGGGSHCFALYDRRYLPTIKAEIAKVSAQASDQSSLFGDAEQTA